MTPEIAQVALQFMQRVQLQGAEVPAFNAVCEVLRALLHSPPATEGETLQQPRPAP